MLFKPSLYAHILNGIFLLFAFILLFQYRNNRGDRYYKILIIYLLFSIAIGIHGLSHITMETIYNYNPFYFM